MKLWTIQTIEVYEKFKQNKVLTGDIKYVYEDFLPAYNWMMNEMNKSIKGYSRVEDSYPIWAWYQWQDNKHKKPDLRYSGHLEKGNKAVRIELEVDENKILLSDFDQFHSVLNYWYLCKSEEDYNAFYEELEASNFKFHDLADFSKQSPILSTFRERIEKSWERIFDLDWEDEFAAHPKDRKSIQAVMWSINWDEVVDVKEFVSR